MVSIPFLGPNKTQKEYDAMHALFLRNDYEQAQEKGAQILATNEKHKDTMLLLAQISRNKEHFQQAWEWYNKILGYYPGSRYGRLGRAKCAYQLYRFEEALDDYLTLYENSFKTLDYLIALGDTYQRLNLHTIALRYYEKAIKQDTNSIKAHIGLGYQYIIMGRYKDAEAHAQTAKDLYYKHKQEYDTNVVDNIFGLEEQVKLLTNEGQGKQKASSKKGVKKKEK